MKSFLVLAALAFAAPASAETIAIVGARILTMGPKGDIATGTVIVKDGRIAAVGAELKAPEGARVIDGAGKILTPGLVETVTPLGLNDTISAGLPGLASNQPRVSAAFTIAPDINPANPQLAEARIEGVTRAVVTPNLGANLFGGQAAVIHLSPGSGLVENPRVAVTMDAGGQGAQAGGGSRGALRVRLKESLDVARTYARTGQADDALIEQLSLSRADLRALSAVVSRRAPLLVEVNRASDIRNVLEMARENQVRVILSGAAEAWLLADEIAAAKVPVILDGDDNQAFTFESLNASFENAYKLQKAGVMIAFKPGIARILFAIRTPRFVAGRATRFGLPPHEALAAITINPARMFGFAAQVGSIEVGKEADLVLWSGDPLETSTVARMVMIKGVEAPLEARSRALRDRYIGTVLETAAK